MMKYELSDPLLSDVKIFLDVVPLKERAGFIAKIYGGWEGVGLDFDPAQYSKKVFASIEL